MQRTRSSGAGLSHDDLAQVIRRAEMARVQFLRENSGIALRAISWSALTFGLALLVVAGVEPSQRQVLENTALMEQLATKLAPIERITPATLSQITDLLRRPDYDCRQIRCDARLEKRNAAARVQLEMIVARYSVPSTLAATR